MHTNSVLCRLFADLVHALSRVNVFHCNAAARPAGAMAAGSYAYLGEAKVVGAGAALQGEAAGPPPAAALPGEAGGAAAVAAALLGEAVVAAAALEGEAAAAAAATFEGEVAVAAGGAEAAAAAGRGVPIILAIGSIAPALTACLLPPADVADR
jgi:hypothetical protein